MCYHTQFNTEKKKIRCACSLLYSFQCQFVFWYVELPNSLEKPLISGPVITVFWLMGDSFVKNYLPNIFRLEPILQFHSLCVNKLHLLLMGHIDLCWQITIIPNSAGPGIQILFSCKFLPCTCLKNWWIRTLTCIWFD